MVRESPPSVGSREATDEKSAAKKLTAFSTIRSLTKLCGLVDSSLRNCWKTRVAPRMPKEATSNDDRSFICRQRTVKRYNPAMMENSQRSWRIILIIPSLNGLLVTTTSRTRVSEHNRDQQTATAAIS